MRRLALIAALGLAVAGCQTITEDLPQQPANPTTPVPVVLIPGPAPAPASPSPGPTPTPAPNPTPTPAPDPGGDIPNNTNPVARMGAKVFFVECGGQVVPNSEHATEAAIGCRIHLDVTAKDASNQPTRPRGTPRWTYENASIVTIRDHPWNPVLTARAPGTVSCYAQVDGVTSNTVSVRLR